ncbi:hypothetical protein AB0J48_20745 [Nocardia salmonicida]|uniref:hypothetical protein n=1 Tax=Nocardia salmonicida TaxID=53431 RepID=UPI003446E8DC
MTPTQSPTKSRIQIAHQLSTSIATDRGRADLVRTAIAIADSALVVSGFADDHRWLCEHFTHIRLDDAAGMLTLAHRLIERLTIEGDTGLVDVIGRTVDALTADVKGHLAKSGDRRSVTARLAGLDRAQLAVLLSNALVRLAGYDAVIDELHQLRAQVDIKQAKAEQAAANAPVAVIA